MTSPATLCPHVTELERLRFAVKSRTKPKLYTVDMEERHGLGACDCEDCRCNKNADCWHLQQVRKFIAAKVAQAVIKAYETPQTHPARIAQKSQSKSRV